MSLIEKSNCVPPSCLVGGHSLTILPALTRWVAHVTVVGGPKSIAACQRHLKAASPYRCEDSRLQEARRRSGFSNPQSTISNPQSSSSRSSRNGGQSWILTSVGVSQQIYRIYNSLYISLLHAFIWCFFPVFPFPAIFMGACLSNNRKVICHHLSLSINELWKI
jgi:hypothetical protein